MKRSTTVLLSTCLLLVLAGCGQGAPPPAAAPPQVDGLSLDLDNGNKWQVDHHTRGSAAAMTALLADAAPIDSVDDARQLASALDGELQSLIAGCTMTGPAHDQLHSVLAALFPRVKALRVETDMEKLRATQLELRSIIEAYAHYFD